jgi:hypothetical protein
MSLGRLDSFLSFLTGKLSAPDYATAQAMLWAAICDVEAARQARVGS